MKIPHFVTWPARSTSSLPHIQRPACNTPLPLLGGGAGGEGCEALRQLLSQQPPIRNAEPCLSMSLRRACELGLPGSAGRPLPYPLSPGGRGECIRPVSHAPPLPSPKPPAPASPVAAPIPPAPVECAPSSDTGAGHRHLPPPRPNSEKDFP